VQQYWPSSYPISVPFGDRRCDWVGTSGSCHLYGWLVTPNNTSAGHFPAVIYVDDTRRNLNRHDACEVVNALVGKGYVVFVAYMRGVDDASGGTGSGFHNTGTYVDDYVSAYVTSYLPWALLETAYLENEANDLDAAIATLQGLEVPGTTTSLVASQKIAIMGREDGGLIAIAASGQVSHHVAAVLDLGGGSSHWQDDAFPYWTNALGDEATQGTAPLLIQEVGNESPNGSYWSSIATFEGADAADVPQAKVALYAPFTITSAEQTTCTNRGYDAQTCGNYWSVLDHDEVARWRDTLVSFLRQYGVQ